MEEPVFLIFRPLPLKPILSQRFSEQFYGRMFMAVYPSWPNRAKMGVLLNSYQKSYKNFVHVARRRSLLRALFSSASSFEVEDSRFHSRGLIGVFH